MTKAPKGCDLEVWQAAREAVACSAAPSHFVSLSAKSRAAHKAVAAVLGAADAEGIRESLAQALGEDGAAGRSASWLLRRSLDRQEAARTRRNPIRRNEAFVCGHCSFDVPPAPGGGIRNHCPRCLRSAHVDGLVPGDRASNCGGLMDVASTEVQGGEVRVLHRCRRCGFSRANRLDPDWSLEPDRLGALPAGDSGVPPLSPRAPE